MTETTVMATFQLFSFILGIVVGSFLNVCIARWPEDRSVVSPRSHCPHCGTQIAWYDNIPIASWFVLRGACRTCSGKIPVHYVLMELLGGLLAWLTFMRFVQGPHQLDVAHGLAFLVYYGFICLLIIAAFVDLRHMIIPNETSIYAIPAGIVGVLFIEAAGYSGWLEVGWRNAVLGTIVLGGFLGFVSFAWLFLFGQVGLGEGDVKLMAMIAAFLGLFPGAVWVLIIGSLVGAVAGLAHLLYSGRRLHLPFGPPLAFSAIFFVLYGEAVLLRLFPHWSYGAALAL